VARLLSGGPSALQAGTAAPASGHRASGALPSIAGGPRAAPNVVARGLPVIHSGTRYQPGRLAAQVSSVLLRSRHHASDLYPGPRYRSASNAAPAGAFSGLSACVRHVTGGRRPLLVDVASYGGRPAAVIVMRGANGARRVLVVGTACTATARDQLATASLPGPR
jgi:hypothetical protein